MNLSSERRQDTAGNTDARKQLITLAVALESWGYGSYVLDNQFTAPE